MALNVSTLTGYVEEKKTGLIRKAVIESRSAREMNLMTGIKGATALNLLNTTVVFGDGSVCGWNEAGTSEVTKRILTPGNVKVNMSFCDKTLLNTWMNYDVRLAAGQKTLPFEEDFINDVIAGVGAKLEKLIWTGNKSSSDAFDGLVNIIEAASAPKYTYTSSDSVASIVSGVYGKLKSEVFEKGDVVMFMGADMYRKYIQELIANGNLVLNAGSGAVLDGIAMPAQILIPGTNVTVIPVTGLDGTGKLFASYRDNFIYGTDLTGSEEKFDFWYSQDNREFRLAIEFGAGVQVAFTDLIVEGSL